MPLQEKVFQSNIDLIDQNQAEINKSVHVQLQFDYTDFTFMLSVWTGIKLFEKENGYQGKSSVLS